MASSITIKYYQSPVGELILGEYSGKLCICDWRYRKMRDAVDKRIQEALDCCYTVGESDLLDVTIAQFKEYFVGKRRVFDVPLLPIGTEFQKRVWDQLLTIPYGETYSYLQLSKKLGNEKTIRAVASANGANAISIIIPCHRIIGADGSLTGYAGGLPAKKKLLSLEDALPNQQLSLFKL
ncbi:methylated-DNA--[protein]-cysteine S-methyltransferase [Saccharicrinis aurantiacus]|uniref:methylated-DNA--[protein]-cysteine S-methyltransferase n=1 Tax=Saccharicrinis aurantiacus TaxID=1849719 RepID=UPI002493A4FE|nr:methylated-DNA--[protein]-cysteine S-methyltransferase [Saccharicrinis aurantiacus]